jgi:hypothetical protein
MVLREEDRKRLAGDWYEEWKTEGSSGKPMCVIDLSFTPLGGFTRKVTLYGNKVVENDSGTWHIDGAKLVLTISGSRDPNRTGPWTFHVVQLNEQFLDLRTVSIPATYSLSTKTPLSDKAYSMGDVPEHTYTRRMIK